MILTRFFCSVCDASSFSSVIDGGIGGIDGIIMGYGLATDSEGVVHRAFGASMQPQQQV